MMLEDKVKELTQKVALLGQELELYKAQQAFDTAARAAMLDQLKKLATAQADLDKAAAQGKFATLLGVKVGLDSIGAPPGKEGSISVAAGTAGALMLGLRQPMLDGLEGVAREIAAAVLASATPKHAPPGAAGEPAPIGRALYIGSDAKIQPALQAHATRIAIEQARVALEASCEVVRDRLKIVSPQSITAAVAATALTLNTLVGFEKFFRVDTAHTIFDAAEDAHQILVGALERELAASGIQLRDLSVMPVREALERLAEARELLVRLQELVELAAKSAAIAGAIPSGDSRAPTAAEMARLTADHAVAKGLVDALHPTAKPDAFWTFANGLGIAALMEEGGVPLPRLIVSVKAQVIQVSRKRAWRSDTLTGRSDLQVEARLLDGAGALIDSGVRLMTFNGGY